MIIERAITGKADIHEDLLESMLLTSKVMSGMTADGLLALPIDAMRKTKIYTVAARTLARLSTLEWIRVTNKSKRRVEAVTRDFGLVVPRLVCLIRDHWFHHDPPRFHDINDIAHGRRTHVDPTVPIPTDEEKEQCRAMTGAFMAHLDQDTHCEECGVLRRPEGPTSAEGQISIKGQIRSIIQGTFTPAAIGLGDAHINDLVERYKGFLAQDFGKYGHLCVWDTRGVTSMESIFSSYKQWDDENWDLRLWDTRRVTKMESAFRACTGILSGVERWSVMSATNMRSMFANATRFNRDIGMWDTSNVTKMGSMLTGAWEFDQDIGNWNTSLVRQMGGMFRDARAFNQDLSRWDTRQVTDMSSMFAGAWEFDQDIGNWNTSLVRQMGGMFSNARAFNQDLSRWDTRHVTDMSSMFAGASSFNGDIGNWNTSLVTDMACMFQEASAFNQDLSRWETTAVKYMNRMFCAAHSMILPHKPTLPIGVWY
jgi:surface protein